MIAYPVAAALGAGMIATTFLVCALFFLKFWRQTRDSLFLTFAVAFVLLALNQSLPHLLNVPREEQSPFYLLRLAAFVLIIIAIVRKNLGRGAGSR